MRRLGILLTLLSIFVPSLVLAQEIPGINNPITLTTIPTLPSPGETTTLQAQSYSFDIDTANIVWTANGKIIFEGKGDKTINLQAGALGSSIKIVVNATTPDGQDFSASTTIAPANIGLIWEGNTYTPPFYKGNALRSWGSSYTVMAIAQVTVGGVAIKPSSLVYTWSKNGSVDASVSGYGKNTYRGSDDISYTRGGDDISVTVSTSSGTSVGQASITIPVVAAEILMYQDSPIYGILYNQALTNTTLTGDSISLRAEPFFFSDVQNVLGSLIWMINGTSVPTFAGNPSITLGRQDKNAGIAIVSASLQSSFALLQSAQKSVTININAKQ